MWVEQNRVVLLLQLSACEAAQIACHRSTHLHFTSELLHQIAYEKEQDCSESNEQHAAGSER